MRRGDERLGGVDGGFNLEHCVRAIQWLVGREVLMKLLGVISLRERAGG